MSCARAPAAANARSPRPSSATASLSRVDSGWNGRTVSMAAYTRFDPAFRGYRPTGFQLGIRTNMTIVDSVAVGVQVRLVPAVAVFSAAGVANRLGGVPGRCSTPR
jgi:hypothetical protein